MTVIERAPSLPRTASGAGSCRAPGRRARLATVTLALVCTAGFTAMIFWGSTPVAPADVLRALSGEGPAAFTVLELRVPRACLGLVAGAAFGVSGAVFQSLLRNPLASPDIIGISGGAGCAAAFGIVVLGVSDGLVSLFALGGALAAAALIVGLAAGPGSATTRMILIGIGVAAISKSLTTLILSRASTWDLQGAMQWLAGSLNGATWAAVWPLALACAIVLPLVLTAAPRLAVLRLGDDLATGLGLRPVTTRWTLLLLAVVLLAAATAAAGPIAFVAFLAGPVATRLRGGSSASVGAICCAAMVGSALVMCADLAGQIAFAHRYPVGVITGAIGAPLLIVLLMRTTGRIGKES